MDGPPHTGFSFSSSSRPTSPPPTKLHAPQTLQVPAFLSLPFPRPLRCFSICLSISDLSLSITCVSIHPSIHPAVYASGTCTHARTQSLSANSVGSTFKIDATSTLLMTSAASLLVYHLPPGSPRTFSLVPPPLPRTLADSPQHSSHNDPKSKASVAPSWFQSH